MRELDSKKIASRLIFGLLGSMAFQSAYTQEAKESESGKTICPESLGRPCVALVLGGGGARGGAHIGVLKALEEYQIPVDLIVGTSIGSFVGGLYASGKSADQIRQDFESTDWNAGFRDALSRSDIPNHLKRQLDDYPIHLDLGFDGKSIKLPKGFIQGQSMKELIDGMLGSYPEFTSFDDLPIPYRAVAADAVTGEQVILEDGDLATAMQTSMSIPGVVRPIELDGRLLVDGGIANNLPVSVAKSLGADIVIAVDIGAKGATRDELNSSFAIFLQLTSFLTQINERQQKALLTENDVLLEPGVDDVGMLEFEAVLDVMEAGYQDALEKLPKSEQLMALAGAGLVPENHAMSQMDAEIHVDRILLTNNTRLADDYILRRMGIEEGGTYGKDELDRGVNRLYGLNTFSRVTTSIEDLPEGSTLVRVNAQEKEWGPGYLNFKMAFEDDFDSFSHYQVGASLRRTNISDYGAEWVTAMEFGTEKLIYTELHWPINNSSFYWNLSGEYKREVNDFREDGESLGNIFSTERNLRAGIGWSRSDRFDLTVNGLRSNLSTNVPGVLQSVIGFSELSAEQSGLNAQLNYDSLDHATFPRRGWKFTTELIRTRDQLIGIRDYSTQIDAELNAVFSGGRHTLRNQLRYQSTIGQNDSLLGAFELGGFLNLSGSPRDWIQGQHVRFASMVYSYELVENNFGAITLPLYLGLSVEAGNAWDESDDVNYGDLIYSGSLFVGWNSPLGPAYLAYGRTDTGVGSFYLFLGSTF